MQGVYLRDSLSKACLVFSGNCLLTCNGTLDPYTCSSKNISPNLSSSYRPTKLLVQSYKGCNDDWFSINDTQGERSSKWPWSYALKNDNCRQQTDEKPQPEPATQQWQNQQLGQKHQPQAENLSKMPHRASAEHAFNTCRTWQSYEG